MDWTLTSGRSIWLQLKERIAMGIVTGEYPPGSKLPTVRELAVLASVNPNTMQRALMELERDGLAKSHGTIGRMVTTDQTKIEEVRRTFAATKIREYLSGMEMLGYAPAEAIQVLEEWTHA